MNDILLVNAVTLDGQSFSKWINKEMVDEYNGLSFYSSTVLKFALLFKQALCSRDHCKACWNTPRDEVVRRVSWECLFIPTFVWLGDYTLYAIMFLFC